MSDGSRHMGLHIRKQKQKKEEEARNKADTERKKAEDFFGRESEQSDFLESPHSHSKSNKTKRRKSKDKSPDDQNCKVGCKIIGGKTRKRANKKKKLKK